VTLTTLALAQSPEIEALDQALDQGDALELEPLRLVYQQLGGTKVVAPEKGKVADLLRHRRELANTLLTDIWARVQTYEALRAGLPCVDSSPACVASLAALVQGAEDEAALVRRLTERLQASEELRSELPCLDSGPACLTTLATLAIAQSREIAAIDHQLVLTGDRISTAQAQAWTLYLQLEPLRLVQNLLGGGDVAANRLAIAGLELQAADLVRRREEVAEAITEEVIDQVLTYEALDRQLKRLEGQLEAQRQRQAVMEIRYRTGQGSTDEMLHLWQQTEALADQIEAVQIEQQQVVRSLEVLCGATADEAGAAVSGLGGSDRPGEPLAHP
jgi:hypothetical protein